MLCLILLWEQAAKINTLYLLTSKFFQEELKYRWCGLFSLNLQLLVLEAPWPEESPPSLWFAHSKADAEDAPGMNSMSHFTSMQFFSSCLTSRIQCSQNTRYRSLSWSVGRGARSCVPDPCKEGALLPLHSLQPGHCCRIPLPARELNHLRVGSSQRGHLQVSDKLQPTELGEESSSSSWKWQ